MFDFKKRFLFKTSNFRLQFYFAVFKTKVLQKDLFSLTYRVSHILKTLHIVVNRHYSIITKIYNFCRFLLNFRGVHGSVHVTLTNLNILAWKKNLDLPWENAIYSHLRKTTFS